MSAKAPLWILTSFVGDSRLRTCVGRHSPSLLRNSKFKVKLSETFKKTHRLQLHRGKEERLRAQRREFKT